MKKSTLRNLFLLLCLCTSSGITSYAQVNCSSNVPYYNVNLTGNPSGQFTTPNIVRDGNCCNTSSPDRCIHFEITLDTNAVALTFAITSGAIPPGALYYQVNCGPQTQVGQYLCISGKGPHHLTFCKPGNNTNQYTVTSISKPMFPDDDTVRVGCAKTLTAQGITAASTTWNSIYPGAPGAYNSMLSCASGCTNPVFTPVNGSPPYIDYVVCGAPIASNCLSITQFCDTVRLYIYPKLEVNISPNPSTYCITSGGTTLTATGIGGLPPYSYKWTNSSGTTVSTTSTYFASAAGNYTCTVSDGLYPECNSASSTVSVTVSDVSLSFTSTNISCNGQSTGTASVSATGGTTPYTYLWSNGSTTTGASGLTAGIYNVTVTDAGGCVKSGSVVISQPLSMVSATTNTTAVLCKGNNTGSATVTASGGTTPYAYRWSNGSTTATINGLTAGTYTITVSDANSCTFVTTAVITEPSEALSASTGTTSDVTCNGLNNGTATVNAAGGTTPYSYLWNNGVITSTNASLVAGSYSVTVTDANGCTAQRSITINQPSQELSVSIQMNSAVSCFGQSNGSATATASGGTSPYTYQWNNGNSTNTISSLTAGGYSVTVTDKNGCTANQNISITEPSAPLAATVTTTEVLCHGNATGGATVNATGGTAPYSYQWSNGSGADLISNVVSGSYSITVTDAKGCTISRTAVIQQPAQPLTSSGTTTDVLCFGNATGVVSYTVNGGTTPYTYNWSNGTSSEDLSQLTAGTYTVTVSDAHSCTITNTYTINQPSQPLNINIATQQDVNCFGGNDGKINIQVTGGSSPYQYNWSNGSSSQNITAVSGTYSVTVTDNHNCTVSSTGIVVAQPAAPLNATSAEKNISCNNGSDGEITVNVTGGTTPYIYQWSNGSSAKDIQNLTSGTYALTITDANGCTFSLSKTLTQPSSPLNSEYTTTDVSCTGNVTGSVNLTVNGGTSPYTFNWSNGSTQEDIINLTSDTYTVTITDANGCTRITSATVSQPAGALDFSTDVTDVRCFGDATGSIIVNASAGTPPYSYAWSNGATTAMISSLISGTYTVTVSDANNCILKNTLFITQPSQPLQIAGTTDAVKCNGDATGSVDITTTGGTINYIYNWSNGANTEDLSGIEAGNYTILVTDANSCTASRSFNVSQPAASLASSETVTQLNCYDIDDASIIMNTSGGTPGYNYQWNNGSTSDQINNLSAGTYSVTITDANGCTIEKNFNIIYTTPVITATAAVTDVNCFSDLTGNIDLTMNGGLAPYSYSWNNGATSEDLTAVPSGQYDVTVTDANGCTHTESFSVIQPAAALQSTLIKDNEKCFSDSSGFIDITPTGGTTPYSFSWNNGASSEDLNGITAGSYSVVITDANGCTYSLSDNISGPAAALAFNSTVQNVDCNSNLSGQIQLAVSGGTAPYIYNWSNGDSLSSISSLPAGDYSFTVKDYNNCSVSGMITVNEPANALHASSVMTAVDCHGNGTGIVAVTPSGGTAPYAINWSNGATSMQNNNLTTGSYTYTVTDANNCAFTQQVQVQEPSSSLLITPASTNVSCTGSASGTISTTISGGTPGYQYIWSTGAVTSSIQYLTAGNYTVTVTDANNCSTSAVITMTEPSSSISATSSITNATCNGGSSGSVSLNVNGGTSPYTVSWSNGATGLSNNNLPAGNYTALITDNNGCTYSEVYTVQQPTSVIQIQPSITGVACYGMNNGSLSVNITGGNPGYSYQWSNGATTNSIDNLTPGSYQVTITDAGGCTTMGAYNIAQPNVMNLTVAATSSNCLNSEPASITTTVTGGTQPYQYQWNTGAATSTLGNLYSGNYSVTVTDANGCTTQQFATVTEAGSLNLNTNGPVQICQGTTTTLSATAIPGVQYQWSFNNVPLNGATSNAFTTPAPGTYTLTATAACGTFTSQPIRVVVRTMDNVSISNSFVICPGEQAQLIASGGTDYVWSPAEGLNNATIYNPVASPKKTTEYSVIITDDFGCKTTATVTVSVMCDTLDVPNGFSPNGDGTNDYFVIDGLSKYPDNSIFIYNRWGNLIYKMNRYDNLWDGKSNVDGIYAGRKLPEGTYYFILDLGNNEKPLNGFLMLKR